VEILSTCPTNWRMSPTEAGRWVAERVTEVFPLGDLKDVG
jgi:2-oxoglutarate ferredoxin oxidoreductase subunit beta